MEKLEECEKCHCHWNIEENEKCPVCNEKEFNDWFFTTDYIETGARMSAKEAWTYQQNKIDKLVEALRFYADTSEIDDDCIDFEEEREELIKQEVRNQYSTIEGVESLDDVELESIHEID